MWFNTIKKGNEVLDFVRFGDGEKPLVLIPGLSFQRMRPAAFLLVYQYRMLAKGYTVYVFDKKEVIPEGYTIREMAGDLAAAMERLGLRGAGVVGISQGGMIAQYLAIDHPQLTGRLVLGVTAARGNEVMEETVGGWIGMAERGDYGGIMADMLEKLYSPAYVRRYGWLLPLLSRAGRPREFGRFIALAKSCLGFDAYGELSGITCPALVIGGALDRVVTGRASEELAERLGCDLVLYPGRGHAAYEEAPDFNARVYRFLAD